MPEINFFWDPLSDNILQERDETGAVTAEYTAEPGLYGNIISQNRGGVESQFHYDAQGSTLAVTDDNQNVTDTFAYSAFGEVTERTGTTEVPFQYIGQKGYYTDGLTGQIMARRRPYEPASARWLSVDPIRRSKARLHPFAYANPPTTLADPSGMLPQLCCPVCKCDDLRITTLGWRLYHHPGVLFSTNPLPAIGLSYVWIAQASTTGTRACAINTWVTGEIREYRDDIGGENTGTWKRITPSIDRVLWSDGRCMLPAFPASTIGDRINCRSEFDWNTCKGQMCYLDAPGGVMEAQGILSDTTRPKLMYCVAIDVTFTVRCYGGNFGSWITRTLDIRNEYACVHFDANGNVVSGIDAKRDTPLNINGLDATPEDLFGNC